MKSYLEFPRTVILLAAVATPFYDLFPCRPVGSALEEYQLNGLTNVYSGVALVNVRDIIKTNGLVLECAEVSDGIAVFVANYTTNEIAFVAMPKTDLFEVQMYDKQGNPLQKTTYGVLFARAISSDAINKWLEEERGRRFSKVFYDPSSRRRPLYRRIYPSVKSAPQAEEPGFTQVGLIDYRRMFSGLKDGEYRVQIRWRLIQHAKDMTGRDCYLIDWLPACELLVSVKGSKSP